MDNLPDYLIIEILSRLNDSTDLARCKCLSKSLNRLARQVQSIHLYCSLDRYTKMRSPDARSKITPFKTIFHELISGAEVPIEYVSLGIDESLDNSFQYDYEFEEKCDDLFLTAGSFCMDWLTKIGNGLKSISISALLVQSYPKPTNILDVISYNCYGLVELTLNNSALCVIDMRQMPLLTRLTLKDVGMLDSHLSKLMKCLPCLEVLNWIDIRASDPEIHHLNLKELKWTISKCESPPEELSSLTIYAPNLAKLELECDDPIALSIDAPLLSYFHLAIVSVYEINVEKFKNLKTLRLVSPQLCYILANFPRSRSLQNLTFDSSYLEFDRLPHNERIDLSNVFTIFPYVTSLTLGSEVWSQLMLYPLEPSSHVAKGLRERLKQITVYLVLDDIDKSLTFILYVKGICSKLTDMVLFFHFNVDLSVASRFVSLCMSLCPKVRFRWRTWKKGTEDCYMSNNMVGAA